MPKWFDYLKEFLVGLLKNPKFMTITFSMPKVKENAKFLVTIWDTNQVFGIQMQYKSLL